MSGLSFINNLKRATERARKRKKPQIIHIVLTKGERAALQMMVDEDEELIEFVPGGWWINLHQISGRVGKSLLRKCLISEDQYSNENAHHYNINEWGRKLLTGDKVYVG